jgi:mevalonate pyrophosphate decarboxylase
VDAGANVHVLTLRENSSAVAKKLKGLPGVSNVLVANAGGPAKLEGA